MATDAAGEPFGAVIEAPADAISEAARLLPSVQALVRPAQPTDRLAILFALADIVGKPDVMRNGSASSQTLFWKKYHDLLSHVPVDVLSRAVDAFLVQAPHSSAGKWFPDPGTILQHARQDDRWKQDLLMAKGLERLSKARSKDGFQPATDEQWAGISARVAALVGRVNAAEAAAREDHREATKVRFDERGRATLRGVG